MALAALAGPGLLVLAKPAGSVTRRFRRAVTTLAEVALVAMPASLLAGRPRVLGPPGFGVRHLQAVTPRAETRLMALAAIPCLSLGFGSVALAPIISVGRRPDPMALLRTVVLRKVQFPVTFSVGVALLTAHLPG